MSFYRTLVATVAALGLATAAFAAETTTTTKPAEKTTLATDTTSTSTTSTTSTTETTKVDVNKATAKELMKVKGLTRAKAHAIVSYRKAHGEFKSLDELKEVKGFKKMHEKTMKEIAEQLTV